MLKEIFQHVFHMSVFKIVNCLAFTPTGMSCRSRGLRSKALFLS